MKSRFVQCVLLSEGRQEDSLSEGHSRSCKASSARWTSSLTPAEEHGAFHLQRLPPPHGPFSGSVHTPVGRRSVPKTYTGGISVLPCSVDTPSSIRPKFKSRPRMLPASFKHSVYLDFLNVPLQRMGLRPSPVAIATGFVKTFHCIEMRLCSPFPEGGGVPELWGVSFSAMIFLCGGGLKITFKIVDLKVIVYLGFFTLGVPFIYITICKIHFTSGLSWWKKNES